MQAQRRIWGLPRKRVRTQSLAWRTLVNYYAPYNNLSVLPACKLVGF